MHRCTATAETPGLMQRASLWAAVATLDLIRVHHPHAILDAPALLCSSDAQPALPHAEFPTE